MPAALCSSRLGIPDRPCANHKAPKSLSASGQNASCETDQFDVICLCRELRLLLSQSRTLLLLHRTQSAPNLFHQLAALVCQTTLSKTSKQIAIAQFHHVLHHLQMLSDHGLDLCERLQ